MQTASGPALVCGRLQEVADHLFTTRQWMLGASGPAGRDLEDAWREVAAGVGVDSEHLVRARQVHGRGVLVAGRNQRLSSTPSNLDVADIVLSRERNFAAAVQVADCVPLLVADRRTGAVAAAHAGWRGLALRVPETTVAALMREFGSRPVDLIVAVGPSIGACCYQVGADVREQFEHAGFSRAAIERWFSSSPDPTSRNPSRAVVRHARDSEHWFFDGWSAVREQLEGAGMPPEQIFVAELCTASHPDRFCSYRRDGSGTGRLAAVIVPGPPGP